MTTATIWLTVIGPLVPVALILAVGVLIAVLTVCFLAVKSLTATPDQQRHAVTLIGGLTDLIAVCLPFGRFPLRDGARRRYGDAERIRQQPYQRDCHGN